MLLLTHARGPSPRHRLSAGLGAALGAAVLNVATALWLGRGVWRMYRGRFPW